MKCLVARWYLSFSEKHFFYDCHSHSRGGGAFDEGDGYDGDGESSWGDRELEVVVGGSVICCVEDVVFELTADGVVGEGR